MNVLNNDSNIITYDKEMSKMSKRPNNVDIDRLKEEIVNEVKEIIKETNKNTKRSNVPWATIVSTIGGILGIISTICVAVYGVTAPIIRNEDGILEIKNSLGDIKNDVKSFTNDLSQLRSDVYINDAKLDNLLNIDNSVDVKRLKFSDENVPRVDGTNNEPELLETEWQKYVYVAEDDEGNEYRVPDLFNVTFTTSYKENGKEIYFQGQYNENSRWNGLCILNVYVGDNLESVLEAVYHDGKLYEYKRVSAEKDGTWKVVDKINEKDYKVGETWIYNKSDDYKKNISFDNYDGTQILTYEDFAYLENEELISYYNGKTSDGYYNEDEHESYLIKYFRKGEIDFGENKRVIKTLYKGNFVNGFFKDVSDKSWYFTRNLNTTYMYYEGSFSNETADHINEKEFENPIGYEYIEQKLRDKGFEDYLSEFLVDY